MHTKKNRIERVATLGLAVWFAVVAGLAHGLHRHPGEEPIASQTQARPDCDIHDSGSRTDAAIAIKVESHESGADEHADLRHCPACLFLKNCKERAVVWTVPAAAFAPDHHIPPHDDFQYSTPIVVFVSPRAPPISAT